MLFNFNGHFRDVVARGGPPYFPMKKLLALTLVLLCGCSHTYVITMNNGMRLTTASKPRLEKGAYVYKDAKGKKCYVAEGRVREIAPASMAKEESSRFKATGQ